MDVHQKCSSTGSQVTHPLGKGKIRMWLLLADRNPFHRFLRKVGNIRQQPFCFSCQLPAYYYFISLTKIHRIPFSSRVLSLNHTELLTDFFMFPAASQRWSKLFIPLSPPSECWGCRYALPRHFTIISLDHTNKIINKAATAFTASVF